MPDIPWTITGKLSVTMSEPKRMSSPFVATGDLVNAQVLVEGSSLKTGGFSEWGTVRTDSTGNFKLIVSKPNAPRRIRVRARFRDQTLKVTAPTPLSDWSDIYESDDKVTGPSVAVPPVTFRRSGDPQDDDHYKRAATWYVCKRVIDELVAHDPWFAFKDTVTIIYPARALNGSYANGLSRSVYINYVFSTKGDPDVLDELEDKGDQWDVPTVLHEFMHIWNYDHNHGASNWLGAVTWDLDLSTHSFQEKPAIAFHEGFAEYAKDELLHHIWKHAKPEPRGRQGLVGGKRDSNDGHKGPVSTPLASLEMVERNEDGVRFGLHLLTTPQIYTRAFGSNNSGGSVAGSIPRPTLAPKAPEIDFWDVLSVFKSNSGAGWPTAWEAKQSSGLLRFFDRVSDILPDFGRETKELYLTLLDRGSTAQPQDRCGSMVRAGPRQPRGR